ncbi:MAG: glycosyltransferase [Firmicutes bacterium]|nr:glycosyltransferase [Bacillota bacterium]
MRIGQYSDSFLPIVDGVGRVVFSYAETLGLMGHNSYVFAPMADMGNLSGCHFQVIEYKTMRMPGRMPYRVGLPQLDFRFGKQTRGIALDIVHVHSPFMMGSAGLTLAKKRRLPVVGSFHSKLYDDFRMALKLEPLARLGVQRVVAFYSQCDEVWAVSASSGETLREYGYQGEIVVMENGTDIRALDGSVLPELRERFALREDLPVLLYVGQLNWKKNILRTLEAAKLLKEQGLAFRLLLAGQGPHRGEMEEKVREFALDGYVTFTGHITTARELDGLYSLSKLFVFPSLYDNAPMVLREAAAMGTPAVLIAGSNAAECVINGQNGLTCEDDAESLRETIARVLRDDALLTRMGNAARDTIPVPWTGLMEKAAERYQALIHRKIVG